MDANNRSAAPTARALAGAARSRTANVKPAHLPPALLALMAGLLVLSSLHKRFSYDELDNLSYGYRFLTRGPGALMAGQRMPVLALNALTCLPLGCRLESLRESEALRLLGLARLSPDPEPVLGAWHLASTLSYHPQTCRTSTS